MTPQATADTTTPRASLGIAIPLAALVLSLITSAGGAYVSMQINSATNQARMEATDKRIDSNTAELKTMVPKEQFATALTDLKEQLADMKLDLKEIRRAVAPR
jgi:hypothetical protein